MAPLALAFSACVPAVALAAEVVPPNEDVPEAMLAFTETSFHGALPAAPRGVELTLSLPRWSMREVR